MTASKTTRKAVAKNTSKASKAATKAPKKTTAKKTTTKKTTVKKAPVKAVKQEKEMTKALAVVEPVKAKPVVETPVETVKTEPVEPVKETPKAKAPKKKISKGEIRHILSPSRGGKIQQRLKGTATGKNQWGHKLGSQAAKIDHLIDAGRFSLTEIQTMSGARTKGRIYNHFRALKENGYSVLNEGGKVKFA
jgi:hypothetical protein